MWLVYPSSEGFMIIRMQNVCGKTILICVIPILVEVICDAPWHFVPKCGKTWRRENALQKWRNFTQLYFVAQIIKRHLLASFKAQEAQIFYVFFAKKYLIMDWKIYTFGCLNNYLTTLE